MSDHQPIEAKHHAAMNKLAAALDGILSPYGFCLLVFPMGENPGRMNYISNANRADMLIALKEFIAANEGRRHAAPETPQ